MSVGSAKLELTKGNEMINTKMPEFARELSSGVLVEFTKRKSNANLSELEAYAYALSLVWSLADNKLKEKVVRALEENNQ